MSQKVDLASAGVHVEFGILTNSNGGHYVNGVVFGMEKKLHVASIIQQFLLASTDGCMPTSRIVGKAAREATYAIKVIREMKKGQLMDLSRTLPL